MVGWCEKEVTILTTRGTGEKYHQSARCSQLVMDPFLFDVVEGGLDPPDAHAPR